MKNKLALLLLVCSLTVGCAKNVVTAPVPGSTNSADATAFRVAADAQAAIHSVKIWALCSAANFPPTTGVDGNTEACDPNSGTFPAQFKPYLNAAINSYNLLESAGQAFHAAGSTDDTALQAAEVQLQNDVTTLVTKIGGK